MRNIYKNGKIVPESEANLSVYDSALMFGDMVFEMTRSFNGEQSLLGRHIDRLFNSAKYYDIPIDLTKEQIIEACEMVQEANQFEDNDEHRLMINISRGILPMYSEVGDVGTNIIITDFPLRWTVAGMGKLFDDGIHAVTPSQRAIPAQYLDPRVKSRSRAHYMLANKEASLSNRWAILLDDNGFIAEGPGWNFFAVHNGMAITPLPKNILSGISRQFVFELTHAGMGDMTVFDVITEAQEAFITATPFCMLPVVSINGYEIGNGKVGPIFNKILDNWSEYVNVDIREQINLWDNGEKEGVSTYKFK